MGFIRSLSSEVSPLQMGKSQIQAADYLNQSLASVVPSSGNPYQMYLRRLKEGRGSVILSNFED